MTTHAPTSLSLEALTSACAEDRKVMPAAGRCVLIVPDPKYRCDCLVEAMVGAADRVAFVQRAADVALALQASELIPAVIVVPLADRTAETRALLRFVRTAYPQVWRLGYCVDGRDEIDSSSSRPLLHLSGQWAIDVELVVRISHDRSCGGLHVVPSLTDLPC